MHRSSLSLSPLLSLNTSLCARSKKTLYKIMTTTLTESEKSGGATVPALRVCLNKALRQNAETRLAPSSMDLILARKNINQFQSQSQDWLNGRFACAFRRSFHFPFPSHLAPFPSQGCARLEFKETATGDQKMRKLQQIKMPDRYGQNGMHSAILPWDIVRSSQGPGSSCSYGK